MALKGKTMRVSGPGLKFALAGVAAILSTGIANAQTFATFSVDNPNTNPIRMFNDGTATSRFGTYTVGGGLTSLLVSFRYTIPNALLPQNVDVTARMTFTSAVNGLATGGAATTQGFRDVRIEFIIEDTDFPVQSAAFANLLTVSSIAETGLAAIDPGNADPDINGTNGTTTSMIGGTGGIIASLQSSEPALNYVGYSSDFLDFNKDFTERSFVLGLSNITPTGPQPPNGYRRGTNIGAVPDSINYVRNFGATLTGSFDSDPQPLVPEPTSLALFLPIMAFAGWGIRKRMR